MSDDRTSSRLMGLRDYKQLAEQDQSVVWHPYTQMQEYAQTEPIIIERGEGPYLYDIRRRRFLDAYGSMWCNVWGHNHPELVKAIQQQAGQLCHASLFSVSHVPAIDFANMLVDAIKQDFRFADEPPTLSHVFYSDNGSTAVEVAMKMALQYQNQKGKISRTQFLTFHEGYHGDTFGAMSASSIEVFRQKFSPSLFNCHHANYPMQVDPDEHESTRHVEMQLEALIAGRNDKIAAVLIEPVIQGASGMRPLAEDYLGKIKKYCREYDILLITDEVFTGFCRTGPLIASSTELVEPDIICLGKGITGGTLPLAVTVANDRVFDAFKGEWSEMRQFLHGHTYSGNPIACAVAIRNLEMIFEEKLKENVKSRARELNYALRRAIGSHERVGQIRQRGLAVGIPIKDAKGNEDIGYESRDDAMKVCAHAIDRSRVLLRPLGNVITIVPPLNIESEQIEEIVTAIARALEVLEAGKK
ncbi:MAG: adenosylmethionine--8-amino-7-oxononanoate transaminase [Planctomycetes bacterium]|nr:adenosylmethionine--8-amino-7-oxononanoate transaminase [Planctomycetota bacterium]MCB9934567.1 adenosylmethionine--8-amino-7-oxononanoate transaminase [Planctomycetota bacterium]